jgi:hypothetical protein
VNKKSAGTKSERSIIQVFVEYLDNQRYPGIRILDWPEDHNDNDIDAVADGLAIEHTSIDTLPDQRQRSAWFVKTVGSLEEEVGQLAFRLSISFPFDAIKRKQEWVKIRLELMEWILQSAPSLPDGHHRIKLTSMPFTLNINKSSSSKPGLFLSRFVPEDDHSLPRRVGESIQRKAKKLVQYKEKGYRTLLIIESDDLALMNTEKMARAVKTGCPDGKPAWVDEIWFVDTSIETEPEFYDFTNLF